MSSLLKKTSADVSLQKALEKRMSLNSLRSLSKQNDLIDFCSNDDNILESFKLGGQGKINTNDLGSIAAHKNVVYLLTDLSGLDNLHTIHSFTNILLVSGGLGVKFENSGVAHSVAMWNSYQFHKDSLLLLNAHVFFNC